MVTPEVARQIRTLSRLRWGAKRIARELGELVAGIRPLRTHDAQITLYKSVGVAAEDAAATSLVLAAARERSVGRKIDL